MGTDYYAVFGGVQFSREELIDPLTSLLSEMDATLETECDPLVEQDGSLEYSFERHRCFSLEHAIRISKEWAGLEFNFVYREAGCSLMIWNDTPGSTTVAFCETGRLFEMQLDELAERNALVRLLVRFMQVLEAPFCVLEAEANYVTPSRMMIEEWLDQIRARTAEKWKLLIAAEATIPQERVPEEAKQIYSFMPIRAVEGWLLSLIGDVELEDENG